MLYEQQVTCPYCGERFDSFFDLSQGNHSTIEDCYVCCRPIQFLVESNGVDLLRLEVGSMDDTLF